MGLIADEIIAQVIDRCNIVEVIGGYVPLKRAGRNFKALCPFHHEKTPSFIVNPDKQIFHCFGCHAGGNVLGFVMRQERLSFPETVRYLADKSGIFIPVQAPAPHPNEVDERKILYQLNELAAEYYQQILLSDKSPTAEKARGYLKHRGIKLQTVKLFKVGYAPDGWTHLLDYLKRKSFAEQSILEAGLAVFNEEKRVLYDRFRNRIVFPIFDLKNRCVGMGARTLGDDLPKYINSPESPVYTKGQHLYGFNLAKEKISKADTVIVVEGYVDCLMCVQNGVTNVVAPLGTALTIEQIRLLRRFTKNITMLFDMDAAGESAMLRSLDVLIEEQMDTKVAGLAKDEDPDSFIRKYGIEAFQSQVAQAQSLFDFKLQSLMKRFDHQSAEGKAKIVEGILPTVARFANAVLQAEYLKILAQRLKVPLEAIQKNFNKEARGSAYEVQADSPFKQLARLERSVLKMMLHDREFLEIAKNKIHLQDFKNLQIREVIRKVFAGCEGGKEFNISRLISDFDDEGIQQLISSLTLEEEIVTADRQKLHRDFIDRIIQNRKKSLRQNLIEQIRLAEESKDLKKLEDLTREFNQLMKG